MEELLASIRLIIADAGKGNTLPTDERPAPAALGGTAGQAGSESASAADDVFELTEELVFPEDQIAPRPEPHVSEVQYESRPPVEEAKPAIAAPRAAVEDFPPPVGRPAGSDHAAGSRSARQDVRRQPPSADIRPVWSRRELPSAASHYQTPSSRLRPDTAPAKPEARNWAQDIQMPVPDQGPVSLIGAGAGRPRFQQPEAGGTGAQAALSSESRASEESWSSNDEAAAVAALAQKLARSAMEAMGSQELKNAQEMDFQRLNTESKADMSEKFADAIERESALHGNAPLPSLLDEVFRHDFIRQREASAAPADEASKLEGGPAEVEPAPAPAIASNEEVRQKEDGTNVQYSAPAAKAAPGFTESPPAASGTAIQPSQAQFVGSAQVPAPLPAGLTLEGAVREMLRPLLVQWLNENMPRILEKAIREEIASRGVFPKTE
jgi:cell pole-organizing protein PopZ